MLTLSSTSMKPLQSDQGQPLKIPCDTGSPHSLAPAGAGGMDPLTPESRTQGQRKIHRVFHGCSERVVQPSHFQEETLVCHMYKAM